MADNTVFTPGTGVTFADDDIGGVKYKRCKLSLGADGTAVDAVAGAGAVGTGVQRVTLASDDPAVTALGLFTKAEDAAHSSGDKGIPAWAVRADTAASTSGTTGDYSALITDANGRLHVINSAAEKAEDAAHTTGDSGIMALSVRLDTAASTAGTDGDYAGLVTDSTGHLYTRDAGTATLAGAVYAEDLASQGADPGVQVLTVRKNSAASTSGTDGDYQPLITDTNGRLHTIDVSGVTIATAIFAEDAAHTSADKGIQILAKRTDAPAVSSGTDADYSTVNVDARGKLWVNDPMTVISVSPTVTAGAYAAGQSFGGKQTLTGAVLWTSGVAKLTSLVVTDKGNQKPVLDILLFNSDPAAATVTDNGAFAFSTDIAKVVGRVRVSAADYVTVDSKAIAVVPVSGLPPQILLASGGTPLYAVAVVVSGTPTPASTSDITFRYGLEQK